MATEAGTIEKATDGMTALIEEHVVWRANHKLTHDNWAQHARDAMTETVTNEYELERDKEMLSVIKHNDAIRALRIAIKASTAAFNS